jgi:hypothetical protein
VVALVLASSASSSGEPRHSFKAADQALARSIVLRPADVGRGFLERTPSTPDPEHAGPRCRGKPDESDLTLTGKAVTGLISRRVQDLPDYYSGALIFLNATQAKTAFQRELTPTLAGCLARRFIAEMGSGSYAFKVSLASHTLTRLRGLRAETAAIRQVFKAEGAPGLYFSEDLVVGRKGRTEAWLYGIFGSKTQTRIAVEGRLLRTLLARMR